MFKSADILSRTTIAALVATSASSSISATFATPVLATEPSVKSNSTGEYRVLKKIKLGGEGGWDYLTIDSEARRLYIGRSDRVMVVDIDSEKLIGEIKNLEGVHGVTVVPSLKKGYITCGRQNLVSIFDLETLKIDGQAATGKNPDYSLYDQPSKKIFAFNHSGTTATVLDTMTGKVLSEIELGGSPESAVADDKGKVFVNLEDKSKIAVVDTNKLKLVATWSLGPGEEPTGLAIDLKNRRLFSGCHNNLMVILNADSGKIVTTLPTGKGVDATGFDPHSKNAFSSNSDGTLTVIHEKDANTFTVSQNVQTLAGARTMAIDTKKHQVWLVSATARELTDSEKAEHKRRAFVPDTFSAIVVGR